MYNITIFNMRYKDIIDLGFERIEDSDPQWFKQYGYEYFRVEKKLSKRHYIDWDVEEQTCELITIDKDHNILNRLKTDNIEDVKNWINIFTKVKIEEKKVPAYHPYAAA